MWAHTFRPVRWTAGVDTGGVDRESEGRDARVER